VQFATNHLGHFALAMGLHDALAAAGTARIVSVSSAGVDTDPAGAAPARCRAEAHAKGRRTVRTRRNTAAEDA